MARGRLGRARLRRARLGGFRLLAATWAAIAVVLAGTIAVLAILGPPKHRRPHARVAMVAHRPAPAAAKATPATAAAAPQARPAAPAAPDLSLAPVDPALTEPASDAASAGTLPVIGPDGRRAATVYAARVPPVLSGQSRLALVVDGVGLDDAESRRAIAELPPAVTLALSPYGERLGPIAAAARHAGHEMLVSIPMEPEGSPISDEGDRQLRPQAAPQDNARNLDWALARIAGYVGATGAEAGQNGAHVANAPDVLAAVTGELGRRGLLYLEPNPNHPLPPGTLGAVADVAIDTRDAVETATDLATLADDAIRNGHAVGVAGPLTDRTLSRLDAFIRTLPASGIVLVPLSSLARQAAPPSTAATPTPPP